MSAMLGQSEPRAKAPVETEPHSKLRRVVIVGGGFGGVAAARALKRSSAEILIIDKRNHHIFQPLLYQVATAVLAPSDIAAPIRQLAQKQKNLSVMLAEVTSVDLKSRSVQVRTPEGEILSVSFDFLVVATGMQPGYFGHDEFAKYAPGLKNLSDADTIRAKILSAYERAELTDDEKERSRLMTFVLVGAGPTGVELAASVAQMATVTLRGNFRHIDPEKNSIILLDGASRILPTFAESLSKKAARRLGKLGVKILTGMKVEKVDEEGIIANGTRIQSATVLWTAGVTPSPLVKTLDVDMDRGGRISVGSFLDLPKASGVFVIGDTATVLRNGKPLPGVAQVAIQQGRYVGGVISGLLNGKEPKRPFKYFDKGNMAVVGKNFALLEAGHLRMSGFLTWLIWAFIHIQSLPQIQNRLRVRTQWLWSYWTGERSSRLISEPPRAQVGTALRALPTDLHTSKPASPHLETAHNSVDTK
jgi:NADH:ubiquinone reductase (H+-translocating)